MSATTITKKSRKQSTPATPQVSSEQQMIDDMRAMCLYRLKYLIVQKCSEKHMQFVVPNQLIPPNKVPSVYYYGSFSASEKFALCYAFNEVHKYNNKYNPHYICGSFMNYYIDPTRADSEIYKNLFETAHVCITNVQFPQVLAMHTSLGYLQFLHFVMTIFDCSYESSILAKNVTDVIAFECNKPKPQQATP